MPIKVAVSCGIQALFKVSNYHSQVDMASRFKATKKDWQKYDKLKVKSLDDEFFKIINMD